MTRPEGLTTSLYSLGAKLFVSVCRSCQAKVSGTIDTFLSTLRVSRDSILGIFAKGKLAATLHLKPSTWGNQRGARSHQAKFLAPLPGTPLFKIGELHAIFFLCFLVLLVYLSVFALVSLIKNHKNSYLACCCYGFRREHQVV